MFDDKVKFKYTFRPYQQRILDEVKGYIKDKKINIVAAPGSGKTIIGLELVRLINNPVIILAPTIIIRDQWIERFISNFTDLEDIPDYISTNIYDLKTFNVVTYQALHYAYKKQMSKKVDDEDTDDVIEDTENIAVTKELIKSYDLIEKIKEKNITTIVLDEAHHLKSEWWKSLTTVVNAIENHTTIALTATPPYDVEYSMWKRYEELCGAVDAEISVPELVAENNLCPHQDYIYFNYPTKDECDKLKEYNNSIKELINKIKEDRGLIQAIQNHKYIKSPNNFEEEILANVPYYSSMLIFLNAVNVNIPRENIAILGHNQNIPKLDLEWLEILLKNIIFDDRKNYQEYEEIIINLERQLNTLGVIEKKNVIFKENNFLKKIFLNSQAKLNSINEITKLEYGNLQDKLRMVILTDYIRKEYLDDINIEIDKIGVLPIFIRLLKENKNYKIAILTGAFFIIPKILQDKLLELCKEKNIDINKISFKDIAISSDYCLLDISNSIKNKVMSQVQNLFSNGDINIIIGTKSLLGEGWDEPSINTLILASFVGSYMLSNQMRGRAIRVNEDINKTANIWHLVCVNDIENGNNGQDLDININLDYEMLTRRFNGFVGIDYDYDIIQNGIARLNGVYPPFTRQRIFEINDKMQSLAINRDIMYKRWKDITQKIKTYNYQMADKIDVPDKEQLKKMWTIDGKFIRSLLLEILSIMLITFFSPIFMIVLIISSINLLKNLLRISYVFTPQKTIKRIGEVLLQCLCEFRFIKTEFNKLKIMVKKNTELSVTETYIIGGTEYENNLFVDALQEILDKATSQRYFIAKLDITKNSVKDYYNVPKILSQNKDMASKFFNLWRRKIGECSLIYSNSKEGRELLIKARMKNINFVSKAAIGKKAIFWK